MPRKISSNKTTTNQNDSVQTTSTPNQSNSKPSFQGRNNRKPYQKNYKNNNKNFRKNYNENSLNIKALSLSIGLAWGFMIFIVTLLATYNGYGEEFLLSIKSVYPGYKISLTGSFTGFLYGFADGFIGTYIICKLYKFLAKKL